MELASCQPCGTSRVWRWLLDFWKKFVDPLGYGLGDLEISVRFTAGARIVFTRLLDRLLGSCGLISAVIVHRQ